jgi:hypothetical protein
LSKRRDSLCPAGHSVVGGNAYPRPDSKGTECRICRAARSRRWIDVPDNRTHHNQVRHIWYLSHLERAKQSARRSRFKRRYGLTVAEYQELWDRQSGLCALCGKPERRHWLAVDHNHQTGQVRGLLCTRCNVGLGWVDNQTWLEQAQNYLAKED